MEAYYMVKMLTIQVLGEVDDSGAPLLHDIEVDEETTVDDALRGCNLRGYRLTKKGEQNFLDPAYILHNLDEGIKLEATKEGKLG